MIVHHTSTAVLDVDELMSVINRRLRALFPPIPSWGIDFIDIENPQRVTSSEGQELYVGTALLHPLHLIPIHVRNQTNF
jgi:hypothetical protein